VAFGFKMETPDLHCMPTTLTRRPMALIAATLLALGFAAAPAGARSAKPAGPALTIESKTCNTGADPAERFVVLTASAVLNGTGDEVQMRFTVQQRATLKTTWRTVFAKTGDLGTWATSDAGADGLRYTKTINGLAEGNQYRVLVDARGISTAGKVVTKVTRKSFACLQPQLSAALVLQRAVLSPAGSGATPVVRATIRNAGRTTSAAPIVTVRDAATQAVLATDTLDPVPGRGVAVATLPIASCPGKIAVTVQETGRPLSELTPEQALTIDCAQAGTVAAKSRPSAT
jgi:hypothetical protein